MNKNNPLLSSFAPKAVLFILLLISGLGLHKASASHYGAVDLYATYIGSGPGDYKYKVTLVEYKACEWGGSPLPSGSDNIGIYSLSTGYTSNRALPQVANFLSGKLEDTLDQLCPSYTSQNSCRVMALTYPGFTRKVFEDTMTLFSANDITFTYITCCRNGVIQNAGSGQGLYIECMVNNISHYNNSSPRFLIDPIPYLCINQPANFQNGPYDPNGDSLRTVFQTPYSAMGTNVTYSSSAYNATNPMVAYNANPFTTNVFQGNATFTPIATGRYIMGFKCSKYDPYTGTLEGYVWRDVQVAVVNCSALPPTIDSLPQNTSGITYIPGNGAVYTACPGVPISFTISGTSNTISNTVYLYANNNQTAAGSTVTVANQGQYNPVATFNWTPAGTDIGSHVVVFVAKDSTCNTGQPIVLNSFIVVVIRVLPGISAGPTGHYCGPNSLPWQIHVTGPPGTQYVWSVQPTLPAGSPITSLTCFTCDTPQATPSVTTSYIVQVVGNQTACKNKDTIKVIVSPSIVVKAGNDQTICANQSISLKPIISDTTGATFSWTPIASLDSFSSTTFGPNAHPYITTQYVLRVTGGNGCKYADSTHVIINGVAPIVHAYASRDTVCPGGTIQLYSNIAQQPCGLAQSACAGTPTTKFVGTSATIVGTATPYFSGTYNYGYSYQGGGKMQIIYTKDDLQAAGISAGFIDTLGFNIASKSTNLSDTFQGFTIKIACTNAQGVGGNTFINYPGEAQVFGPKNVGTHTGWNNYAFTTPYYWDGNQNLMVEICYNLNYGGVFGGNDQIYATPVTYTSTQYLTNYYPGNYGYGNGCAQNGAAGSTAISSLRPNLRLGICNSTNYTFTWNPSTYLDDPTKTNPIASNITSNVTYTVTVASTVNTNCVNTGVVPIGIDHSNSVKALPVGPTVLCVPGYVLLDAIPSGPKPLINLACGSAPVTCSAKDTVYAAAPGAAVNAGTSYNDENASPFGYPYAYNERFQYLYKSSELSAQGLHSGTLYGMALNFTNSSGTAFNNVKISIKCTNNNSVDALQGGLTLVYTAPNSLTFPGGWYNFTFDNPYNWDTTQNLLIEVCYANGTSYPSSGVGTFVTYNNTPFMSSGFATVYNNNICANPNAGTFQSYTQRPITKFNYCHAPEGEFHYTWKNANYAKGGGGNPGTFISDTSIKAPTGYVPASTTFYVYTQGRNGCVVSDSSDFYIQKHSFLVTPQDTSVCLGQSFMYHASGEAFITWYEDGFNAPTTLSCTNCFNPISTPVNPTHTYTIVVGDTLYGVQCNDTFKVTAHAKPLPMLTLQTHDTTIKYGQSFQLFAGGAYIYAWSPVSTLSNPNVANPVAAPTDRVTTYSVVGIGNNGCHSYDSAIIRVDYRDNLMVPTAFTPNGDGRNDIFRIANLTFQKITEFRVFNRWGQELYSSPDNRGWDGTWKGVAQDIGVYQYIIRVAFPDGFVETYKGDVTLVR